MYQKFHGTILCQNVIYKQVQSTNLEPEVIAKTRTQRGTDDHQTPRHCGITNWVVVIVSIVQSVSFRLLKKSAYNFN